MNPRLYIAHFTNVHGEHIWQTMEREMPICAETTCENAHAVYQHRYLQIRNREPVCALPPIWNGDAGEFEEEE